MLLSTAVRVVCLGRTDSSVLYLAHTQPDRRCCPAVTPRGLILRPFNTPDTTSGRPLCVLTDAKRSVADIEDYPLKIRRPSYSRVHWRPAATFLFRGFFIPVSFPGDSVTLRRMYFAGLVAAALLKIDAQVTW